jgi:hypothetical protein
LLLATPMATTARRVAVICCGVGGGIVERLSGCRREERGREQDKATVGRRRTLCGMHTSCMSTADKASLLHCAAAL